MKPVGGNAITNPSAAPHGSARPAASGFADRPGRPRKTQPKPCKKHDGLPAAAFARSRGPRKPTPPRRGWRRPLRWPVRLLVALLVLLIAAELFARFYLGLGDPPLSMADPEIEYLFKPDQTCYPFHKRVHYNAWSMRSEDFPRHKSQPDELRVMVFGDSVVNGGSLTDHADLATTILQRRLSEDLGRPVVVGNISAGSWARRTNSRTPGGSGCSTPTWW